MTDLTPETTELDIVRRVCWAWKASGTEDRLTRTGTHCIQATRIGLEVLGELRIEAHALPCAIVVRNTEAVDASARGLPVEDWPPTAWSVGVNPDAELDDTGSMLPRDGGSKVPGGPTRGWNGHLILEGGDWIADLSGAQFARPLRGIDLHAWAAPRPDLEEGSTGWTIDNNKAINIKVYPRRQLAAWRSTESWRSDPPGDVVLALVHLALTGPRRRA